MIDPYALVRPLLHRLDPEQAHELGLRVLERGLVPPARHTAPANVRTRIFNRDLAHPLGLAAGFDKNARVVRQVYGLGFSWAEAGGVTPLPQAGNPRPRVYRLPADEGVVNRMGFPNDGADRVLERLRRHGRPPGLFGVNLASNADSADPVRDFTGLAARFAPFADFLTLDISCPNTANGRLFLEPARLRALLAALAATDLGTRRPALVAKLSPDIDARDLGALIDVLDDLRIDAICAGNTTTSRPANLRGDAAMAGGLSGRPLFALSTAMLADVYRRTGGRIPLIGTGGIFSGADAYAKIRAGATAVQLYTAMIYYGPGIIGRIVRELSALLKRDGFADLQSALGVDAGS